MSLCECTSQVPKQLLTLRITDYIVQSNRFLIFEEYGCINGLEDSGLSILLVNVVVVGYPLLSLTLYSRKFYH